MSHVYSRAEPSNDDVPGAAGETLPGSEPVLPPALPQPSSDAKAQSKPSRPNKPASKPAKAVELPPEIFQRDEPFVPPPTVAKVPRLSLFLP